MKLFYYLIKISRDKERIENFIKNSFKNKNESKIQSKQIYK